MTFKQLPDFHCVLAIYLTHSEVNAMFTPQIFYHK